MNPIVVTFFLSALAAVSGDSSPYEYEQSYTPETHQYTSEWHSPAAPKSYLDSFIKSRQASIIDPGLLASVLGTGLSLGTTVVTNNILQNQVNTVRSTADTAKNKGSATCQKVNEVLNVAELTSTQTSLAAVTNFQLTKALVDAGATTLTSSATINGKSLANAQKSKLATTTGAISTDGSNIGVTAQDFDSFRKAVNAADLALQAKIDEILKKTTLTC